MELLEYVRLKACCNRGLSDSSTPKAALRSFLVAAPAVSERFALVPVAVMPVFGPSGFPGEPRFGNDAVEDDRGLIGEARWLVETMWSAS